MTITVRFPFLSANEYDELVATIRPRCLGCAVELPAARDERGYLAWTPHGSCARYYGVGERVDYDQWCAILDRAIGEPLFDRWASAEAMCGVPSWVPVAERGHLASRPEVGAPEAIR